MHVVVTSQLLRFQVLIVAQPSGKPVSLEENVAMISEGTTGLVTWEAALYLAEWALENTHVFTGRSLSRTKVHHAGQCVGSKKIFLFLSIHLVNIFPPHSFAHSVSLSFSSFAHSIRIFPSISSFTLTFLLSFLQPKICSSSFFSIPNKFSLISWLQFFLFLFRSPFLLCPFYTFMKLTLSNIYSLHQFSLSLSTVQSYFRPSIHPFRPHSFSFTFSTDHGSNLHIYIYFILSYLTFNFSFFLFPTHSVWSFLSFHHLWNHVFLFDIFFIFHPAIISSVTFPSIHHFSFLFFFFLRLFYLSFYHAMNLVFFHHIFLWVLPQDGAGAGQWNRTHGCRGVSCLQAQKIHFHRLPSKCAPETSE